MKADIKVFFHADVRHLNALSAPLKEPEVNTSQVSESYAKILVCLTFFLVIDFRQKY